MQALEALRETLLAPATEKNERAILRSEHVSEADKKRDAENLRACRFVRTATLAVH
jgi:hypothetical protein